MVYTGGLVDVCMRTGILQARDPVGTTKSIFVVVLPVIYDLIYSPYYSSFVYLSKLAVVPSLIHSPNV